MWHGIGEKPLLGHEQAGRLGAAHKLVHRVVESVLGAEAVHILGQLHRAGQKIKKRNI